MVLRFRVGVPHSAAMTGRAGCRRRGVLVEFAPCPSGEAARIGMAGVAGLNVGIGKVDVIRNSVGAACARDSAIVAGRAWLRHGGVARRRPGYGALMTGSAICAAGVDVADRQPLFRLAIMAALTGARYVAMVDPLSLTP